MPEFILNILQEQWKLDNLPEQDDVEACIFRIIHSDEHVIWPFERCFFGDRAFCSKL